MPFSQTINADENGDECVLVLIETCAGKSESSLIYQKDIIICC